MQRAPTWKKHGFRRIRSGSNGQWPTLLAVGLVGLMVGSGLSLFSVPPAISPAGRTGGAASPGGDVNGGSGRSSGAGSAPSYEGLYSVAKTLELTNNTTYVGRNQPKLNPAYPVGEAYDPESDCVYVLDYPVLGEYTAGSLTVVNLTVGRAVTSMNIAGAPVAIVYDPADQAIVVASQVDPLLTVVNASSNRIQAEISLSAPPASLAYLSGWDELVVGVGGLVPQETSVNGSLMIFNATSLLPIATVPAIYPVTAELWVPPDGSNGTGLLYVIENALETASGSGTSQVGVFSPKNDSYVATVPIPTIPSAANWQCNKLGMAPTLPALPNEGGALGYDPLHEMLYVAPLWVPSLCIYNHNINQLLAISLENYSRTWTISTTSSGNWNQTNRASALFMGLITSIVYDPGLDRMVFSATGNESLSTGEGYLFEWDLNSSNSSSLESTHTIAGVPGGLWALSMGGSGELLLSNPVRDMLDILNATTSSTETSIPIGITPLGAVFDPVSDSVYVCEEYQDVVAVINPTTLTLRATVPVGGGPVAIAVDPVSGELAVANSFTGNVSILSARSDRVVATVAVGGAPIGVSYDPLGGTWLVTNSEAPYLTVISAELEGWSGRVMLPGGGPSYAAVVDGATRQIYVSQLTESNVTVLNATTYAREGVIGVGRGPMTEAVVPREGEVVVSSVESGVLSVINASRMSVVENRTFPYPPVGMVDDPATGLLLITEPEMNALGVLDPGTNYTELPPLQVGSSPWGLALDGATGTVEVANSGAGTVMEAVPYGLTVTVTETGLPSGTPWWINVSSIGSWESRAPTLSFELVNGTYGYSVGTTDRAKSNGGGFFVLAGAPIEFSVAFEPYESEVTWTSVGLPGGVSWWVTINGTKEGNGTTGTTISLDLGNGSYRYGIGTSDRRWAASGGELEVNGSSETLFVRFHAVEYGWVVTERGLPNGTAWAVELGGRSYPGVGSAVTLELTNGSYRYGLVSGNRSYSGSGGEITVAGGNGSVGVRFVPELYRVEFVESGLADGTAWTVTINGAAESSRNGTIEVGLANGSYRYEVSDSGGVAAVPSSGELVVSGSDPPMVVISFVGSGGTVWYLWAVGGGAAVAGGLILGVYTWYARRPTSGRRH